MQRGREVIASAIDVELPHPDDPDLYGAMASIQLPCDVDEAQAIFHALRNDDKIEVPIFIWGERAWLRISGYAAFNTPDQYVRLAEALRSRLRA